MRAKATNRVKNEFRQELNKILKICQDKIVQVLALSEIEPLARAENLSTEQFVKLYNNFSKLLKIN